MLHELLTGKRLFDGETVSHTLADVLRSDIDLSPTPVGPVPGPESEDAATRYWEARIGIDRYLGNPVVEAPVASRSRWAVAAALGGWGAFLHKPA